MFDLGWAELMFLAMLALIVIGPQDLPKLARAIGQLWGRAQRLYRDSLWQIRKLETEMDLAAQPDQRDQPSYYNLLPEQVRAAMEQAEPRRDSEQNQQAQARYEQALAEVKASSIAPGSSPSNPVSIS